MCFILIHSKIIKMIQRLTLSKLKREDITRFVEYLPTDTKDDHVIKDIQLGTRFQSLKKLLESHDIIGLGFRHRYDKMHVCMRRFLAGRMTGRNLWVMACRGKEENGKIYGLTKDVDISFAYMDYVLTQAEFIDRYQEACKWMVPAVFRDLKTGDILNGYLTVPSLLTIIAKFEALEWDGFSRDFYDRLNADVDKMEKELFASKDEVEETIRRTTEVRL